MNPVLGGILGYVVVQLIVGLVVSRRIKTEADYLVAGRRLGGPLAVFSIFATWFGAETCIGAAGGSYSDGLAATSADPFGYAFCIFLMGAIFAVPLWRRKLITLADLFRAQFSPGVERLASILMIPTSVLWAAAQIRAFGQVLAANSDALSVDQAIAIATAVVLLYTIVGGLLADAYTDLVQGALLMIGLVVLLVLVLGETGGLAQAIDRIPRDHLSFRAEGESLVSVLNAWCIPILGSLMAQELISRVSAARTATLARRAALIASAAYLAFGLIPVFIGLFGAALVPGLENAEHVLPAVAERYLSTVPYVLFVGVLVSAILSTVDSALLVSGSLLSHNLVVPYLPRLGDRGRLLAARLGVFVFGICAYLLARASESVLGLVEEASGFGSQGILVIAVFGLFTRFGRAKAAYVALVLGVVVWSVGHFRYEWEADYLIALAAALGGYVAVGTLEGRRDAWVDPRDRGGSSAGPG